MLAEIKVEGEQITQPTMLHVTGSSIWQTQTTDDELAEYLFKESDQTYSFWCVESHEDVLLTAHFLSAGRREPFERSVHFVGLLRYDLCGLTDCYQADEADAICLGLRGRHYNVRIATTLGTTIVAKMRSSSIIAVPKVALKETNRRLQGSRCRHYGGSDACECDAEPSGES